MARPSDFNQEIADAICERMICGAEDRPESLRSICRDDDMPAMGTVMRWLSRFPEFQEQYAHAREMQAEAHHEEIIEIADDCTDDVEKLLGNTEGGLHRINHSAIARAKLRIDTRKWAMTKMAPKKYGDKQEIAMTVKKAPLPEEDAALLDEYAGAAPR